MELKSDYLGKEKLSKLMLKFSIPCVLSLLISALYNIVDQIFIGNSELSTLGNAATGVVFPAFVIAQAFAWGLGDGCAAYINLNQGQSNTNRIPKCVGTGIFMTGVASLLLLIFFYPFKTNLLLLFGASDNSIVMADEYFTIILAFFPVFMLSNMINSVIRADGSPAWAMASMLVGAIINLILDPIFIFVFHFGMTGAAYATGIGQLVTFLFSTFYLFFTKTFKLSYKAFIPDWKIFIEEFKLGLSSFVTQLTIVVVSLVGNFMLAKYGALSKYGTDIPIAIMGIESKVFTVIINLVVGIILGCQPIIGYNIGAGNYERVKTLYKVILLLTLGIGTVSTLIFEFAPSAILSLFGEPANIPNPNEYWEFGRKTFQIFLSLMIFTCIVKMTSIFFMAVGKSIYAVMVSLLRDIVFFVPLILILPNALGIEGILYAAPISDGIAMLITAILVMVFFKGLNHLKKEEAL